MNTPAKKLLALTALAMLVGGAALCYFELAMPTTSSRGAVEAGRRLAAEHAVNLTRLESRERQADETVWSQEILAEACGRTFEILWDEVNAATNKLRSLLSFPVGEITLGDWKHVEALPHGIELRSAAVTAPAVSPAPWGEMVADLEARGWELTRVEFRHNRFDADSAGRPKQSVFYFEAELENHVEPRRATLEGDLIVDWAGTAPTPSGAAVRGIDASRLILKTRPGKPPFRSILDEAFLPQGRASYIDPLIVYDLDGDGIAEIILAGRNVVYRRRGTDRYTSEPLLKFPPAQIWSAVIADFDGDGHADFLCANSAGLLLFQGSPQGTFDQPGRLVWSARPALENPMVLTCGDIDRDGDLDVFLGQYRVPTLGTTFRPSYFDADDSHPSFLLLNDGQGNFSDATVAAGLAKKRQRRVYSASFVDLTGEGNQDLVVVSDFAGADVFRNRGDGHFADVTSQWLPDAHGFGMGHVLADFTVSGRLGFLMVGMTSPAVDRLDHLGLVRPGAQGEPAMRSKMTFGNRLYVARSGSGFERTELGDSLARSGWSWGCAAFDADNDGFPDVYVAAGNETRQTVRDYEPEFWLHDQFVAAAVDESAATGYFAAKFDRTRGAGWSYGGHERNRLFVNRGGESFYEVGHLMGVALAADSRNVVAADLDGDGRVDLLVTTLEVWPQARQTLRVYRNLIDDGGHWIGFRFHETGPGKSPVGARATILSAGRAAVRAIVTGDSHRSQSPNTLHFGLGAARRVERVEIRWPSGQSLELRDLDADRYYNVDAPAPPPLNR